MAQLGTVVAGVDVGERSLDVAAWPEGAGFEAGNDAGGHGLIVGRLRAAGVARVGVAASGGGACPQAGRRADRGEREVAAASRRAEGLRVVVQLAGDFARPETRRDRCADPGLRAGLEAEILAVGRHRFATIPGVGFLRARVRRLPCRATPAAARCGPAARAVHERLTGAGKQREVALVACMRELVTVADVLLRREVGWERRHA